MESVQSLRSALVAVSVSKPCTAAAVAALHVAGHAVAPFLFPELSPGLRIVGRTHSPGQLQDACVRQQLPGACLPVLAWLAAGLSSGLPAAASQQAQEVACVLLGVVSLVVPEDLQQQFWGDPPPLSQRVQRDAVRTLQQLGAPEEMCKTLAQVGTALVALLRPAPGSNSSSSTTTTSSGAGSSSGSSSRKPPAPQQVAFMMFAWQQTAIMLTHALRVGDEHAVAPALMSSGLYQVLLEGALLLLALDPRDYSQEPEGVQLQLAGSLRLAVEAAITLVVKIGERVKLAWAAAAYKRGMYPMTFSLRAPSSSSTSNTFEPWMRPLFKLAVLLLAKTQWDARQQPDKAAKSPFVGDPMWPAKALAKAVRQVVSPCMAGDLLQQRAPGLVPHAHKVRRLTASLAGMRWEVVEQPLSAIPGYGIRRLLSVAAETVRACVLDQIKFNDIDHLDLAVLLEATELYCLVSPDNQEKLDKDAWVTLYQSTDASPYPAQVKFAAACGEALLSIAEYLVEDVLLVSSSGAAAGRTAGSTPDSTSTSSSSSRPRAGSGNAAVTLQHRIQWAQVAATTLGHLMRHQQLPVVDHPAHGSYLEQEGYGVGVVHAVLTSRTAPRLSRLLETVLRTPQLQGPRLQNFMELVPWRLPLVHVAASSPAGSRALLSAVTTAAKGQQVGQALLCALIQARGQLAPAAAAVVAAVPGSMGQAVAQQLLKQPSMAVWHAVQAGLQLSEMAIRFMARAAALLDPVLAPLAAYLAATRLLPGQDGKPWAVEAVLHGGTWLAGEKQVSFHYQGLLVEDKLHMSGMMQELSAALALQQAAAVQKQANKLAKAAGGGAAEAEQLRQQLQRMWLGGGRDAPAGLDGTEQEQLATGQVAVEPVGGTSSSCAGGSSSSSSSSSVAGAGAASAEVKLPHILQRSCANGILKQEEILAAGDPSRWSTSLGPTTEEDLRVASTALLAACKAAGAVAQLQLLMQQLQPVLAQQPWGQGMVTGPTAMPHCDPMHIYVICRDVADWALLLAPLLAVLLPAQQAAELQEVAAGVKREMKGIAMLSPTMTARVLGLLGHVMVPGAPGCSYPGCCNMEGRSEAELATQVCSKCRGARYCCRDHQVAHWKAGHKEVCRAAQAVAQQVQATTPSVGT